MKQPADKNLELKALSLILISLLVPFVLIIMENTFLPYPEPVEELFKLMIVVFVVHNFSNERYGALLILLSGFLFSLSENIFYLVNLINIAGDVDVFFERFLIVTPMHIATALIMFSSYLIGRKIFPRGIYASIFLLIGYVLAVFVHLSFNTYMSQ